MVKLLRMQKRPSFSETKEEICDFQNEPIVQKLFEDAIEVLRLAGAYEKVELTSSEVSHHYVQDGFRQEKKQLQQNSGKQAKKPAAITRLKRRKIERIKAPVTILRKMKQVEVPSEEEQEGAVQRMLNYVHQMPSQETFQPPALPCVSLDEADECENTTEKDPNSCESIQDYTYLSNEKDIALWKMLVASPTNCNIFVGGLDHGVTSAILQAAFEAFSVNEEDKAAIKTHVVMDAIRCQSKGYGFVSFPCRRSAELAMICMQDFEINGRAMQLGWGQENSDQQPSNNECFRETKISQKQNAKESPLRTLAKPKGDIVSDTVYCDEKEFAPKPLLKRGSSRWDQEKSKRYKTAGESAKRDQQQGEPNQENKEKSLLSEGCSPISPHSEPFSTEDSSSVQAEHPTSDPLSINQEDKMQWHAENRIALLHENEINCSSAVSTRNKLPVKQDNKTDFPRIASHSSLDMKGTRSGKGSFSSPFGEKQDLNRIVLTENGDGIETRMSLADGRHTLDEKSSCNSDQIPRRVIHWLTHDQKVAMIKSVCSKLRGCGVRGHLGVFGVHYESDNSRLYVVCAKHVTQTQLLDEFKVFGTAVVKLNCDVNGFSKGCAFVQYTGSVSAEKAIKQLHGKVVGGMPIKVMVAEPKVRKGSREKKTVM